MHHPKPRQLMMDLIADRALTDAGSARDQEEMSRGRHRAAVLHVDIEAKIASAYFHR
jgi:hypothetical protein